MKKKASSLAQLERYLKNEGMTLVKKHIVIRRAVSKLTNKEMLAIYQQGKVIEEVGEFIAAYALCNWAKEDTTPLSEYGEVRGTIESEAADIVVSAMYFISYQKSFQLNEITLLAMDDSIIMHKLLQLSCAGEYSKLISTVHMVMDFHGKDLLYHVASRLAFNNKLLDERMTARNKEEAVKAKVRLEKRKEKEKAKEGV